MSDPARPRRSMRFRGRSYIAFVLTPEAPVFDWLADLDAWTRRSAGFFVGKPVVLDLAAVELSKDAVAHLVAELQNRDIRIMGIEGMADLGPELPPVLKGGRTSGAITALHDSNAAGGKPEADETASAATAASAAAAGARAATSEHGSLLLENPVRSG